MNKYEELAAIIIDLVSEEVERQHPEIKHKTKYAKESDVLDDPALVVGVGYYNLESHIAEMIRKLKRKMK